MPARYDAKTGRWVYDDPLAPVATANAMPAVGSSPFEQSAFLDQRDNQMNLQTGEALSQQNAERRPMFAENPLGEAFNIAANAGTALVTDYLDLAAGLGDLAVQSQQYVAGQGFNWDKVLDDSDNPWTKWRRQQFEPKSQAGQLVSNVVRVGVSLLTLPKVAAKGVTLPLQAAKRVPVVGGAAGAALKGIDKVSDAYKGLTAVDGAGDTMTALQGLRRTVPNASKDAKLLDSVTRNDWLFATYDDVGRAIQGGKAELTGVADWFDNVRRSTAALTQLGKASTPQKIKTIGEALAWDAFVAFNVYGEGDAEMDETFSDFLASFDNPIAQTIGSPLATMAEDNALTRKFKQMVEGIAMAVPINAAFDMYRVYRYSKNFKAGSDQVKAEMLKRLSGTSQEIGASIGQSLTTPLGPIGRLKTDELFDLVNLQRQAADGTAGFAQQQVDLQQWMTNRIQAQQAAADAAQQGMVSPVPGMPQAAFDEAAMRAAGGRTLAGAPDPQALPGTGVNTMQLPPADGPVAQDLGMVPVTVFDLGGAVPRPPEPVVTPQTIRNGFAQDAMRVMREMNELTLNFGEGADGVFTQMSDTIKRLVPRTRVDALEYLQNFPPQLNEVGMPNGIDSIWTNFLYDRGLQEGWASIDPDTFQIRFNRAKAAEFDRSSAVIRQAEALDQARQIDEFNTELVDVAESFKAAQQEQPIPIDAQQSARLAEMEQDPALRLAAEEAAAAADEVDRLDASEALRLSEAELLQVSGRMGDEEVVREMLGTTLDTVQPPQVLRAEVGRGWEVFDQNGELIGRTTTQKAARKLAEQQLRKDRDALLARARQMEADATDEALNVQVGVPVFDSDIVGKIKLTDAQISAVQGVLPRLDSMLDQAWMKRRGESAFFNINQLGPQQRTFELTQGDMKALGEGIRQVLQDAGDLKGSAKLRALRNLADKLDTQMKLLAPEARAQKFVDELTQEARAFMDTGKLCDYL
jgi:hypothetical protein